jgi:excisionase family DNA binding protein
MPGPAFSPIPEKPAKTPEKPEIRFEPGLFRADICSGHRKPSERELRAMQTVPAIPCQKPGRMAASTEADAGEAKGNMADAREVMNIRQASQYLGVSPDTLYKYVGEQRIPAFKLGNRWRFKKSRLDQWMEEKSSQMEPQSKRKAKAAVKAAGQS